LRFEGNWIDADIKFDRLKNGGIEQVKITVSPSLMNGGNWIYATFW